MADPTRERQDHHLRRMHWHRDGAVRQIDTLDMLADEIADSGHAIQLRRAIAELRCELHRMTSAGRDLAGAAQTVKEDPYA